MDFQGPTLYAHLKIDLRKSMKIRVIIHWLSLFSRPQGHT